MSTHRLIAAKILRRAGAAAATLALAANAACSGPPAPFPAPETGGPAGPADFAPLGAARGDIGYGIKVELASGDPELILNGVRGLRFDWVSQSVSWRAIEPQAGSYQWEALDRAVRLAHGQGLRILLTVSDAPDWARPIGSDLSLDGPPADLRMFGQFAHSLASRYAGTVAAYEIWPGANLASKWNDPLGVSPAAYTQLLRSAYAGVKSADPLAIVVSGGVAPVSHADISEGLGQEGPAFLQGMYESSADPSFDVLGIWLEGSVYPPDVPDVDPLGGPGDFRQYEDYREVALANADAGRSFWITDVGWGAADPQGGLPGVTEEQQAEFLVSAFRLASAVEYIDVMVVNNFNYSVTRTDPRLASHSLIRPDWTARPAFLSLAKMRQDDLLAFPVPGNASSSTQASAMSGTGFTSFDGHP